MRWICVSLIAFVFAAALAAPFAASAQEAKPAASPAAALPSQADLPLYEGTVADGVRTIVVIESPVSDTVIDLAPEGDSMGDLLVFANAVYDESHESIVGTDQGSCVRTVPGAAWECTWTLLLSNGQIVVQGPFLDVAETSTLAITGGAGAYAGARGEMTLSSTPDGEFMFTYAIIEGA